MLITEPTLFACERHKGERHKGERHKGERHKGERHKGERHKGTFYFIENAECLLCSDMIESIAPPIVAGFLIDV